MEPMWTPEKYKRERNGVIALVIFSVLAICMIIVVASEVSSSIAAEPKIITRADTRRACYNLQAEIAKKQIRDVTAHDWNVIRSCEHLGFPRW